MELAINRKSPTPVYEQISDQLATLITTGRLSAGQRLPPPRALASELHINRHTISSAYQHLQEVGLVVARNGSGTYVAPAVDALGPGQAPPAVLARLDEVVVMLAQAGLKPIEIGELARSRARLAVPATVRVSSAVIECNTTSVGYYSRQLERELGITVIPVLLPHLADPRNRDVMRSALSRVHFAVTTYHHLAEVRSLAGEIMGDHRPELFTLAVRPQLEFVARFRDLPPQSTVAIVYTSAEPFAPHLPAAISDLVTEIGSPEMNIRMVYFDLDKPDPTLFRDVDVAIGQSRELARIRSWLPGDCTTIDFAREIDPASISMLRDIVAAEVRENTEGHVV